MTVLLVSSPAGFQGLSEGNQSPGLVSVASCLARAGIGASVLDLDGLDGDPQFRGAAAAILAANPSAVGFSTLGASYPVTLRLAREVASARPDLPIVLGGPQATVTAAPTLAAFPEVDVVVRGRCEAFVAEVFEALSSERSRERLARLPGIAFRDGGVVVERPLAPDPEPSQIPFPDHSFVASRLRDPAVPAFVEAGLGCPARCSFCSVAALTRGRRMLPVERVVAVVRALHERYGTRKVSLVCDCLTQDRGWVLSFCEALRDARLPVSWSGQTRADLVDGTLLATMRNAGCDALYFGVETGSERMQDAVGKRLDPARTRRTLQAAGALGMAVTASFVVGFPDETPVDLAETARLATELAFSAGERRLLLQVHLLSPLAGSPLEAEHRGALVRDAHVSDLASGVSSPADDELIGAHPELFPAHFHIPVPALPRPLLAALSVALVALPELRASASVLAHDSSLGFPERFIAHLGTVQPAAGIAPPEGGARGEIDGLLDALSLFDGWLAREAPGHALRALLRLEAGLKLVRSGGDGKGRILDFDLDVASWFRAIRGGGYNSLPDPPGRGKTRYLLVRRGASVALSVLEGPGPRQFPASRLLKIDGGG